MSVDMWRSHIASHNMTDKELLFSIFRSGMKTGSEKQLALAIISSDVQTSSPGKNTDIITSEPQPHLILCRCILWEYYTLRVTGSAIKDLNAPEMINVSQAFPVPENEF